MSRFLTLQTELHNWSTWVCLSTVASDSPFNQKFETWEDFSNGSPCWQDASVAVCYTFIYYSLFSLQFSASTFFLSVSPICFFFHFLSQRSGVLSSSIQKWWHMSSSQLPVSKSAFLYILGSLRRFLSAFSTQNTDTVVWFCVWVWYIKRGNHRDVFITVRSGEEVFKICCRIIDPPDDIL